MRIHRAERAWIWFGMATLVVYFWLFAFAAIGGTILFASVLMFAAVAIGTLFTPKVEYAEVAFAAAEEPAAPTPAWFDHIERWALVAVVLAVLPYVGPVHDLLSQHVYGAPGMRTW
jgi:cytochrome c oxidase subunit 1